MNKRYRLIASGYASMDRLIKIHKPAEAGFTSLITNKDHAQIHYGGCSSNVCYILNRLGSAALPVLRVGPDWNTNGYREYLRAGSVPLDAIREMAGEITGGCYIIEDTAANHITLFYPGAMDGKHAEELNKEFFIQSSYALMTVASQEDNTLFLKQCKAHKVPLILGMKMDSSAFPELFLKELLYYSSIVFTNRNEESEIMKIFNLKSITGLFKECNTEIIVTTHGKNGSCCYTRTPEGFNTTMEEVCPVENKIVDYTGAGDAYMAGFLHGLFTGKTIQECCGLGSACSSFIIEKMGCTTNAPSWEELSARYTKWKGLTI